MVPAAISARHRMAAAGHRSSLVDGDRPTASDGKAPYAAAGGMRTIDPELTLTVLGGGH